MTSDIGKQHPCKTEADRCLTKSPNALAYICERNPLHQDSKLGPLVPQPSVLPLNHVADHNTTFDYPWLTKSGNKKQIKVNNRKC